MVKKMDPVVHFELPADDKDRMAGFYSQVFGWETQMLGAEMNDYVLVTTTENNNKGLPKSPGAINGGIIKRTVDHPTKYPSMVIAVDNLEASMKEVSDRGGELIGEPHQIPGVGDLIYFKDPEGNIVSMLQPMRS